MARDAELDRLRAAQDQAFQRKQDAYDAMQQAWERRTRARDELNRAHETKQGAYAEQDITWQRLQSIRDANGPRIGTLNSQQESAYQNMKRSFESASSAYERGDKASAKSYAEDGHRYKAESQGYVAERRRLVEEIRQARAEHEATKPAFQRAKENFASAKRRFDAEKAAHERAQDAFKQAKAELDRAQSAFRTRLERVKAETARRKESKRAIAEKAGVPFQYRDSVWVTTEPDGTTNVYFGGLGSPNGPGHGHYVLDRSNNVTYRRDPLDLHGSQNFQKANDAGLLYIRSARRNHLPQGTNEHGGVFYRRSDGGGTVLHITQYFDDGYRVSWDATSSGNRNVHWTNQRVSPSHPERHTPPSDAAL